jgi:hypothetical protein
VGIVAIAEGERPETVEFRTIAGILGLLAYGILMLWVSLRVSTQAEDGKSINPSAIYDSLIILGFLAATVIWGGFFGQLSNNALQRASGVGSDRFDRIYEKGKITCRGTFVILFMLFVIGIYVVAYSYIVGSIHENDNPVHYISVVVNAIAIAGILFVTIRYAEYVRLLSIAYVLCHDFKTFEQTPSDGRAPISIDDARKIRDTIFKRETLFEPPGSLFVVIGITGTFMGLALGLTTLPLREILDVGNFRDPITHLPYSSAEAGRKALELAMPFVRSMGLALGISTMGVIGSVAAQWLRGFSGPAASTEQVLANADELIRHQGKPPSTTEQLVADVIARLHEILEKLGPPPPK